MEYYNITYVIYHLLDKAFHNEEVIYLCINYTANSDVSILNKVVKEKNIIYAIFYFIKIVYIYL